MSLCFPPLPKQEKPLSSILTEPFQDVIKTRKWLIYKFNQGDAPPPRHLLGDILIAGVTDNEITRSLQKQTSDHSSLG